MSKGVSNEPIVWFPFSVGGMLSALFVPINILIFGLILPIGDMSHSSRFMAPPLENMKAILHWPSPGVPLVRIFLFVLITSCFFFAVHRIRGILIDMGLTDTGKLITLASYGSAIVGTMWAFCSLFFGWDFPAPPH